MATSVAFVPGEQRVLYALLMPNETTTIKEYVLATGGIRSISVATNWHVESLKCAPDGYRFAYADCQDRNLVLVDAKSGTSRVFVEGIYPWQWCWATDGKSVYCIRENGRSVFQKQVDDPNQVTELFAAQESQEASFIVSSPDGRSVGIEAGGTFHTIDLATLEVAKRCRADHYFAEYSWNPSGVCYLDKVGAERETRANLMVYDLAENREKCVATGAFAYPRWISKDEIVVRQGNAEVWRYHIQTLKGEKLFPLR
jgi:hypothetical protein